MIATRFALISMLLCSLLLGACGGGGSSGGQPSSSTPTPFSITGTWKAMSWAGIHDLVLDETAGSLKYTRVDEITGVSSATSITGMRRGGDGAYLFNTPFTVGGQPLNIALYRVDDNTLTGVLLSSLDGKLKLSPVVASRGAVTDAAALNGLWSLNWFGCPYSSADQACKLTPDYKYSGFRAYGRIENLVATECYSTATTIAATCDPMDEAVTSYNALGGGVYTSGGDLLQAFAVGGQTLLFTHYRDVGVADPLVVSAYYAPRVEQAATAFAGAWRAVMHDGRLGSATLTGDALKVTLADGSEITGTFKRNQPWNGLAQLDVTGQDQPYFVVGNEKLLVASGMWGQIVLHRE